MFVLIALDFCILLAVCFLLLLLTPSFLCSLIFHVLYLSSDCLLSIFRASHDFIFYAAYVLQTRFCSYCYNFDYNNLCKNKSIIVKKSTEAILAYYS